MACDVGLRATALTLSEDCAREGQVGADAAVADADASAEFHLCFSLVVLRVHGDIGRWGGAQYFLCLVVWGGACAKRRVVVV